MLRLFVAAIGGALLLAAGYAVATGDAAPPTSQAPAPVVEKGRLLEGVTVGQVQSAAADLTTTGFRELRLIPWGVFSQVVRASPYLDDGTTLSSYDLTDVGGGVAGVGDVEFALRGVDKVRIRVVNNSGTSQTVTLSYFLSR